MFCSHFKFTYFGVVLLDHDEDIERQPTLPATGDAQVVSFAGAETGAVFGRGNERQTASWTRMRQWESHAEAHGWAAATRMKVPLGKAGPLKIEIKDGATLELRDFVLTSLSCEPHAYLGYATRDEFSGQGTQLVVIDRGGLGGGEMAADTRLIGAAGRTSTMAEDEI